MAGYPCLYDVWSPDFNNRELIKRSPNTLFSCNCSHAMPGRCRFQVCFFLFELYPELITFGNIYHSQNLSSNRNKTVTRGYVFTDGRISFRFQTLPASCEQGLSKAWFSFATDSRRALLSAFTDD